MSTRLPSEHTFDVGLDVLYGGKSCTIAYGQYLARAYQGNHKGGKVVLPLVSFLGLHLSTGTLFPCSSGTNSLLPPSKILRDMRVNILSFSVSKKILKLLLINKIRMSYI